MKIIIGIAAQEVLRPNTKRVGFEITFIPSSIIAANTGLVYHKTGGPPSSLTKSGNYDGVMNSGASVSRNIEVGDSEQVVKGSQWIVSDTADQIVSVLEFTEGEPLI